VLAFLAGCSSAELKGPRPLTTQEIIDLSATGVSPGEILQRMRDSRTVYLIDAGDIIELHGRGVSVEVLQGMLDTWKADVFRRAHGHPYYYDYPYAWWYPWGPGLGFGVGFGW
jgi:hypothetical protein